VSSGAAKESTPQTESMSQQEQFANDFHKYIKEAMQILHKKNKIESKTQLRDYIISYTQEKMNYPATEPAMNDAKEYIMTIINDAFPNLCETLDDEGVTDKNSAAENEETGDGGDGSDSSDGSDGAGTDECSDSEDDVCIAEELDHSDDDNDDVAKELPSESENKQEETPAPISRRRKNNNAVVDQPQEAQQPAEESVHRKKKR
jgi:hypothetical protein